MAWRCGGRSEVTWLSVWWFPFVASLVRTQVQMVVYGLGLSHYTRDMLMGSHVVSCGHGFIHVVSCVHAMWSWVHACMHGFRHGMVMCSWVHATFFGILVHAVM